MKTLTREEVINFSLLLHKADEDSKLIFDRRKDGFGYSEWTITFWNGSGGYMVALASQLGGVTSFGIGTADHVYVTHTVGKHEFCPELAALCAWIKQRAELATMPNASVDGLVKLIKNWMG